MKVSFFKSIRVRIVIIVVIMISIPFAVLQYTNTVLIYDNLSSKTIYTTEALARSISTNVGEFMNGAYSAVELLGDNREVTDGTELGQKELVHAITLMPYFTLLYMQDDTGQQLIRSSGELANRSDRWWFKQITHNPQGFISDAYISVNKNELVTSVFLPVFKEDSLKGILGADLTLSTIQTATGQYWDKDITYMVLDSKGSMLTGSEYTNGEYINYIEQTKRTVKLDSKGNYVLDASGQITTNVEKFQLSATMQTIISNALDKKTQSFQFHDEANNIVVCSYQPIDLPGNSEPWSVIVFQKQTDNMSIMLLIIIFFLLVIFCIAVTLLLINRTLLRPVLRIQQDMDLITNGTLDLSIDLPADNEIGQLASGINIMVDSLKHQQQRLDEDEKLASLGGLVAGVAHEINTPLGIGVTTSSYMQVVNQNCRRALSEGTLTKEDLLEYMETMDESLDLLQFNLERGSNIIQSFKKIAVDQSADTLEEFQLKSYLQGIVLSLVHEYKNTGHSIEIQCEDELTICSYPGAFAQILTNLIMNSLNHAFSEVEHGLMSIEVTATGQHLILRYSDNGCGISEEVKKHLFTPFYTTGKQMGGSGLGLSIVYNLVTQKLGGSITVESEEGKGIVFIMDIPL